jgi:hypothetical protein
MSKVYTTMFLYGHKILHCIPAKSAGIPLRMTNIKWFTFLRFSRAVLGGLRLEGDIKAPPEKNIPAGRYANEKSEIHRNADMRGNVIGGRF